MKLITYNTTVDALTTLNVATNLIVNDIEKVIRNEINAVLDDKLLSIIGPYLFYKIMLRTHHPIRRLITSDIYEKIHNGIIQT